MLLENRKVYASIATMFYKMGTAAEVVVFTMFEDKDAAFLEQTLLKDKVWYCRQFLQSVGWVGKDEVKLLLAAFDETEGITSYRYTDTGIQLFQTVCNKPMVVTVLFDAHHTAAAA